MLTSPKLRLALSVALLAAGLGLPVWALRDRGAPWSFQDRAAMLLDATGTVEVYGGTARPGGGGALDAEPGLWLMAGDEIRVGSLSAAVVRTPACDLELADGARLLLAPEGPALARGLMWLTLAEGRTLTLGHEGSGSDLSLVAGRYRFTADGRGQLRVFVEEGRVSTGGAKRVEAAAGELLVAIAGKAPLVRPAPEGLELSAELDREGGSVEGKAAPGAQLYVSGRLVHLDASGTFSEALPPGNGDVVLFARDPVGNTARQTLSREEVSP